MNMINASNDTIRVPVDLFHPDTWEGPDARPSEPVAVEPGDVVQIDDHYALRAHGAGTSNGKPVLLKSRVEQQCPQLKPADEDARKLFESSTVGDLDDVKRTFAELDRAGKASAGTLDAQMTQAAAQKAFHAGYAAALGIDQPKPTAKPRIVKAQKSEVSAGND